MASLGHNVLISGVHFYVLRSGLLSFKESIYIYITSTGGAENNCGANVHLYVNLKQAYFTTSRRNFYNYTYIS